MMATANKTYPTKKMVPKEIIVMRSRPQKRMKVGTASTASTLFISVGSIKADSLQNRLLYTFRRYFLATGFEIGEKNGKLTSSGLRLSHKISVREMYMYKIGSQVRLNGV